MATQSAVESTESQKAIHTLNVHQIQEAKKPIKKTADKSKWYNRFHYWLILGLIASVPFVIIGFFRNQFFYLAPIGPVAAAISYVIYSFLKMHKLDVLEG